ncbi:hypothetical protein CPAR01_06692 [Colletotrichum paranaense]|uniref:Uncharacterized protein n=5 Tax=Colletotrichum acutatum species complex TaxID=2707335 RepID=A0A9Q8SYP3_9PEZI|nr:hypothetical protein CMEL01_00382 [Colletotrichum melonis]KAK1512217.1 hypothetical protein CTAM01_01147 [Colletotrichum tamarilloi]KAK1518607.1 hypothetical protein CABS01_06141 [Colletotrichum abscissum]KAK1530389.1 hypothetical protein CCOS01_05492 [Colletotrichum costaricense]KAK1540703.1 hypothetical protein CPAR01_06692 [Colletotrichum paranaense]UQC85555.1 hypothetical protein CLUP02_11053 [Colletotrichum lupini]
MGRQTKRVRSSDMQSMLQLAQAVK